MRLRPGERAAFISDGFTISNYLTTGLLFLCAVWVGTVGAEPQTIPQRIVSINQCADELLLNLADSEQIASVTYFTKNPQRSYDAAKAQNHPHNHGRIEEIISFAPDLVLAGEFNARLTLNQLHALGIEVVEIKHAQALVDVVNNISLVAQAIGHPERGRRLADPLKSLADKTQQDVVGLVYQANGFAVGSQTLVDDVLAAVGIRNLAGELGIRGAQTLSIERLLWHQPDLLILDAQSSQAPSLAHQVLKHPALRSAYNVQTVSVPTQAWTCGSHHTIKAIESLRLVATQWRAANEGGNERIGNRVSAGH